LGKKEGNVHLVNIFIESRRAKDEVEFSKILLLAIRYQKQTFHEQINEVIMCYFHKGFRSFGDSVEP